jgi:lysophospholipase L1-like esterase
MAIHQIAQVQNFCHKLGAKLYLLNMIDISWMSVILTQYPNYLDLLEDLKIKNSIISYIDVGTDNRHPGPKQHQQWADKVLKFINNFKNY